MEKVQKKIITDHTFPKGIVLKNIKRKSEYRNSMTQDSTSSLCILYLLIRTNKTYFRKMFFLVLCECLFHGWSAQQNVTRAPAFRYYVLLFQPISPHSELFHSQFESINSLLVLVGCCCICSFILGEGT